MSKRTSVKKLASVAFVAMVLVLAAPALSMAGGAGAGHGFSGGHHGGFSGHGAFIGHGGVGARPSFHEHRGFVRHGHDRVFIGVGPTFSWWPAYPYPPEAYWPPQGYWYYCPSAGAYYPYAQSCPEPWVPVPAG